MSRTARLRSACAAPAYLAAPGALAAKYALPAPALTARCGGRVQVSDGTYFFHAMVNKKPAVEELIQAKQDAMINSIASVRIKCTPHPKFPAQKLAFIQSLEILQEGGDKIGDPQKYEADGMAKATHSPAVAHDQQEVMIPWTCPSRAACFATPKFPAIQCVCTLRHAFVPIRA